MKRMKAILGAALVAACGAASAAPVMMSAEWAKAACEAWNGDATLTAKLHESGWVANHKNRGHKALQVYRKDCEGAPRVELHIAGKDGKAVCIEGVPSGARPLDFDVDYAMYAETPRWVEMGKGEYGPMKAMFFGRLGFEGPMGEAMGNMGPFESFLLLVGKVASETGACPK